jgi:hypothetical protein
MHNAYGAREAVGALTSTDSGICVISICTVRAGSETQKKPPPFLFAAPSSK